MGWVRLIPNVEEYKAVSSLFVCIHHYVSPTADYGGLPGSPRGFMGPPRVG